VPSSSGSQEPSSLDRLSDWHLSFMGDPEPTPHLTEAEHERIADGEPYCFRCGKPASSFSEYAPNDTAMRAEMVRQDEGTYNPATNRFACDECYIAIGMPVGEPGNTYGWKAP
jgi:hypothetical protein